MTATLHKLPEPTYRPDIGKAFQLIDMRRGDNAYLVGLAEICIGVVAKTQDSSTPDCDATPAECQRVVNALFIAWAALGEALGIPRDTIVGDEDLHGGDR